MEQIKHQAEIAMDEADVIVFVVSGKKGSRMRDEYVTRILYKTHKPVILAVNKVDKPRDAQWYLWLLCLETGRTTTGIPCPRDRNWGCARCHHRKSSNDTEEENPDSSNLAWLVVQMLKVKLDQCDPWEDRVIASPVAGTTRDAIDTHFTDADGQEFTMIDTAGRQKVW